MSGKKRFVLGLAEQQTYELMENGRAIRCLMCGLISWNPSDVDQKYCGACHVFHPIRVVLSEDRA